MAEEETQAFKSQILIMKSDLITSIDNDPNIIDNFTNTTQYQSIIKQPKNDGYIIRVKSLVECEQFSARLEKIIPGTNQTQISKSARKKMAQNKKKYEFVFVGGDFYWKCVLNENESIQQFGIKKIVSFLDSRSRTSLGNWLKWIIENSMQSTQVFTHVLPLLCFIPDYLVPINHPFEYPILKVRDVSFYPFARVTSLPLNTSLPLTPNSFLISFYHQNEVNCHTNYSTSITFQIPQDFIFKLHETQNRLALQLLLNLPPSQNEKTVHPLINTMYSLQKQLYPESFQSHEKSKTLKQQDLFQSHLMTSEELLNSSESYSTSLTNSLQQSNQDDNFEQITFEGDEVNQSSEQKEYKEMKDLIGELPENLTEQIYLLPFHDVISALPSKIQNNYGYAESYHLYLLLLQRTKVEVCLGVIKELLSFVGNPYAAGIVQSLPEEFTEVVSQAYIESIPKHSISSNFFEESLRHLHSIPKSTNLILPLIHVLKTFGQLTKEELSIKVELIIDFIEFAINQITSLTEEVKMAFVVGSSVFVRLLYDFDDLTPPIAKNISTRIRIGDILSQIIQFNPDVIIPISTTLKNCIEQFNYTPYNPLSYGIFASSGGSTPNRSTSRSDLYSTISRSSSMSFNENYYESWNKSKSRNEGKTPKKNLKRNLSGIETVRIGNIIGIRNIGSTCYLNSIFQQLYGDVYFRNSMLLIDSNKVEQPFLSSIKTLFVKMIKGNMSVDPRGEICEMRNKKYGVIKPNVQRDAGEMLMEILDSLSDELKGCLGLDSLKKSYLIQTLTEIRSCDCSHNRQRMEEHVVLPLEIKGLRKIEDSLEIFTGTEYIGDRQYKCEECHKQINIKKQMFFYQLPNTVIFQLKRFDFNLQTFQQEKINSGLSFPEYINLRPYTYNKIKDEEYYLVGVVVHSGNCGGGHYTSYVKDGNKWYLCNDDQVVEVKKEYAEVEWFGTKNKAGYLLFYRRITPIEEIPIVTIKTSTVHPEEDKGGKKGGKKSKGKKPEIKFEIIKEGEKKIGVSCLSSFTNSSFSETGGSCSMEGTDGQFNSICKEENKNDNEINEEIVYSEQYLFEENVFYLLLLDISQHIESCTKELVAFLIQIIMFSLNERRSDDCGEERKQLFDYILGNPNKKIAESLIQSEIDNKVVMTKRYCFNPRSTSAKYTNYFVENMRLSSKELNQKYLYQLFVFYSTLKLTKAHCHAIKTLFGNGLKILKELSSLGCTVESAVLSQLFTTIKQSNFYHECSNNDVSAYYNFIYSLYNLFDCDVKHVAFLADLLSIFKNRSFFELQKGFDFQVLFQFLMKVSDNLPSELLKSRVFVKVYECLDSFYSNEDSVLESPLYNLLLNFVKTFSQSEIKFIIGCLETKESECTIYNHILFTLIYDCCFRHQQQSEIRF